MRTATKTPRMTPRFFRTLLLIGVAAALLGGCAEDTNDPAPGDERTVNTFSQASLALMVELEDDADVEGVEYTIQQVDCSTGAVIDPDHYVAWEDLEALTLPVAGEEFMRFDENSEHDFVDHYVVLEAGCYDIHAAPTAAGDAPSESCATASAYGVEVVDGHTTEVLLLSQCEGEAVGGLDTVVAFNTPPAIVDLDYTPSKFAPVCEPVELCVTAEDPDGDPVEFVWTQNGDDALAEGLTVTSWSQNGNRTTECVTLTPGELTDYSFTVTAFDQAWDDAGQLIRMELLAQRDNAQATSRDTLDFPLYIDVVEGEEPAECLDDDDDDDGGLPTVPVPECTDVSRAVLDAGSSVDDGTAMLYVPKGSCPVQVSFSSYYLPGGLILPFNEQVLYDNVTAVYEPGTYIINVDLPECSWQTDLYMGPVIPSLNPFYGVPGNLLIDWDYSQGTPCGDLD